MRESLILLVAAAIVFGLSLSASFHFDDYAILSAPVLTSSSGLGQVWRPLQTRPLTYFSFWLNYQLGRRNPAGYHAVNLALHLAAVLLLWDVLARMIPRRPAFVASLLFALHPIQAEAVVYIFARATLLATVFCLVSLRFWIKGRHWWAVAWFAVALLAKEECAAFPLFLMLLHLSISRNTAELRAIGAMLGLALVAGLRVLWVTAVQPGTGAGFQAGISSSHYLAAQGVVILRYFRLLIFPWGFTVDPDIPVPPAWIGVLCWLLILAAAVVALRRFSGGRAGFWFAGGLVLLLPSSSIFPAADLAADRRLYLPMLGFSAAAALLLRNLRARYLAPAVVLLAVLSFGRTRVWLTEKSLWQEAVEQSPNKIRPKIQLARSLPPAKALAILEQAKQIAPHDARVAAEMGKTYMLLGRPQLALGEFGRALALAPNDAQALNNRGVALLALGQYSAARGDFERALKINPCLFDARLNLKSLGVTAPDGRRCRFSPEQRRLLK